MSNSSNLLTQQNDYHKKGYEYLCKALEIDEKCAGNIDQRFKAVVWYRKGIAEFENGIAVNVGAGVGEKYERAKRLREKMLKNLELAKERLTELENLRSSSQKQNSTRSRPLSSSHVPAVTREKPAAVNYLPRRNPEVNTAKIVRPVSAERRPPASNNNNATASGSTRAHAASKVKQMKGIDNQMANIILDQILTEASDLTFADIAGVVSAKQALQETVILPALKPELFTGLRSPVQGLLLFGPPGNGKTMLAKAVATEAKCRFFNISASVLTSKYVGDAEKLVRTLFVLARELQPSIIFIDEIDSILCERREGENEVGRRLKTEFLLQFDGVGTSQSDRILVMGATNRPYELDDAVLRRFPKRIYVGLPDEESRLCLLKKLLKCHNASISHSEFVKLTRLTDGYSFCDLTQLAKDAAYGAIRDIPPEKLKELSSPSQLRPICLTDFVNSLQRIRASTNAAQITKLVKFNQEFGELS